jgi:uncharacterized protein DUF6968
LDGVYLSMTTDRRFAIASMELTGVAPDGRRFPIRIGVGHPYEDPKHAGVWLCPLAITGIDEHLPDLGGSDSFQALCMAVGFIRRRLVDTLQRGTRLMVVENEHEIEFPLDAYFPPR